MLELEEAKWYLEIVVSGYIGADPESILKFINTPDNGSFLLKEAKRYLRVAMSSDIDTDHKGIHLLIKEIEKELDTGV